MPIIDSELMWVIGLLLGPYGITLILCLIFQCFTKKEKICQKN
jgi:hypothetical protein|nr:MAG TPA: hypothetical protein [Caudoviricetes sp.]